MIMQLGCLPPGNFPSACVCDASFFLPAWGENVGKPGGSQVDVCVRTCVAGFLRFLRLSEGLNDRQEHILHQLVYFPNTKQLGSGQALHPGVPRGRNPDTWATVCCLPGTL